ncbi:MAG: glycosyltransferase [Deltaproteobacteria bacterium]|nr:glycosyltransferase [Candidatus Zymogenaceae bacterium]
MKKLKVLRIITRLNVGGPSIHTILLTKYLDPQRFDSILAAGEVGEYEGDMSYYAEALDITPIRIPGLGREISPFDDFRAFFRLLFLILSQKPDIIHTHLGKAGTLGRGAGFLAKFVLIFTGKKIKIFHTLHGHFFYGYFNPVKTRVFIYIERILARMCTALVVISPLQKQDVVRTYRVAPERKVRLIPLGFDFTNVLTAPNDGKDFRRSAGADKGCLLAGIVGRLTGIKNHRLFLEGVSRYHTQPGAAPLRFVVVGDGELREELEAYARELEIDDAVCFVGWRRDMGEIYRGLDMLVITSDNEGTPVTVIEAMAAGVPVISTAVGGVPDLFGISEDGANVGAGEEGKTGEDASVLIASRGVLIPPNDSQALARALGLLAEDEDLRRELSDKAREYAREMYDKDRLVKDMALLYRETF